MMETVMVTPLGKMMWEQRIFELSGNCRAVEIIQKKISDYINKAKVRKPKDERCQHEGSVSSM